MDKYKMLITGKNNALIDDCFKQLSDSFDIISTSPRYEDMLRHLTVFRPDVFAICLKGENKEDIGRFAELKREVTRLKVSIVVFGDHESVVEFEKTVVYLADQTIEKPYVMTQIKTQILDLLSEKKKHEEVTVIEEAPVEAEELRKKILVIDDDPAMLKIIKEHLCSQYDVATAISGRIAYKFLENKEADLILLDYEMPVEKGPQVLENIRKMDKYKDTPVMFLTGISDRDKIREALALKPQGYLLKPIDKEKLLSAIQSSIG
ncbi:MAG: response regulator [Lachnospiraceae bacterium]|nr:response regulator [Lachnospiraceae bacterium]